MEVLSNHVGLVAAVRTLSFALQGVDSQPTTNQPGDDA